MQPIQHCRITFKERECKNKVSLRKKKGISLYPGSGLVDDEIVMFFFDAKYTTIIFTFNQTSL